MTHPELIQYFKGFIDFDYDFSAELYFYTSNQRLYSQVNSNTHMPNIYLSDTVYGRNYGACLFNTELQYQASIRYQLMLYRQSFPRLQLSFIEIFIRGEFLCRHFIRYWQLAPHVSLEQQRKDCPFLRRRLIAAAPMLNWRKIQFDAMFNPNRNHPIIHYVK